MRIIILRCASHTQRQTGLCEQNTPRIQIVVKGLPPSIPLIPQVPASPATKKADSPTATKIGMVETTPTKIKRVSFDDQVSQSTHCIHQNNATTSGFEMWFAIGSQHFRCAGPNQNTSRIHW